MSSARVSVGVAVICTAFTFCASIYLLLAFIILPWVAGWRKLKGGFGARPFGLKRSTVW